MADWSYGVNSPETVKIYSHKLFRQAIPATTAAKLCLNTTNPKDPNNAVQLLDETQKGPGDVVKFDLIATIDTPGVQGDNIVAGNEVSLNTYQTSLAIDQLRIPVLVKGAMSQQRVPFSMRDNARDQEALWWRQRVDVSFLNQMAGNTAQTNVVYTGMNATIAPNNGTANAGTWLIAGGQASEAALTSSDTMSLTLLNQAKAVAQTTTYPIRPIKFKGGLEVYICIMHPFQARDLKNSFGAGQWGDIQLAALKGGQITGNPLFTGALGMYENVLLFADGHSVWGDSSQNVRHTDLGAAATGTTSVGRAIFLGAQAGVLSFGRNMDWPMRVKWVEEMLDAGNQLRVTAGMIWGFQKTVFNSSDFGSMVMSTYASPTAA